MQITEYGSRLREERSQEEGEAWRTGEARRNLIQAPIPISPLTGSLINVLIWSSWRLFNILAHEPLVEIVPNHVIDESLFRFRFVACLCTKESPTSKSDIRRRQGNTKGPYLVFEHTVLIPPALHGCIGTCSLRQRIAGQHLVLQPTTSQLHKTSQGWANIKPLAVSYRLPLLLPLFSTSLLHARV